MGATTVPERSREPQKQGSVTWVVGSSGLLGSAMRRAVLDAGGELVTTRVPWSDPDAAVAALLDTASSLPPDGWRLVWCAGAGVVASSPEHLDRELALVGDFLDRWQPSPGESQGIFLASSAGGVYAGSGTPPYTEDTVPAPVSPYGMAKLRTEELFSAFAERTGVPLLIGRISNLYGPGQNLTKGQGLVSLLCRAHVTGKPLDIYVSLDTIRDYLFTEDAAAMALAGLDMVAAARGTHVKILASGQALTIAGVIGEVRKVTRKRPPILGGTSAASKYQTPDLRMHSVSWPPLEAFARTPVSVGVASCLAAVEANLRCPQKGNA